MRKIIVLLVSCLLFLNHVFAQRNGTVRGVAFDTLLNQPVNNATITLVQKKDSSLVSFSMTDNNGQFELIGIPEGEYRLLLTHINYHNSNLLFTIDNNHKKIDLGKIVMNDKNKVLSEVIITSEEPPVTLVGDTIQYNAGSFKIQPNASVEQLLKNLPGMKVEKDGTFKAQGETVKKVLVDGKEFFGNDPKIATKNLPADAVDKVQVYDRLSDQAQLTGFDDGNSEKTINLKLKKDRKKGMFGKINGGAGTDDHYEGKFNVNSFKGARQMSVIGMGNNTNSVGFSFMDILNFTGALNQLKGGGGNININISPEDPVEGLLGGNNAGINTTFGGGLNYNNIVGTKTDFQSNYFYSRFNPTRESHVQRQYFLPTNLYNQNSFSDNLNNSYRFNLRADYQVDSFHSIKISPSFSYQQTRNNTLSDYSTLSEQMTKINDGYSNNSTNSEGYNLNTNILFRKKFNRKGRTFSLNLLTNLSNSEGKGTVQSVTGFYNQAGSLPHYDSVDQRNINDGDLRGYTARAVYSEPIFKGMLLEFSIGNSFSRNTSSKITYDFDRTSGKFDRINSLLTNDFENSYGYTNAGIRIRKQAKKYNYTAGVAWQHTKLEGEITSGIKDSVISKIFYNLLPNARFQYYFSRFKNLTVNYNTNTRQPSISQMQPLPDNSNPLYVKQGNPDLRSEFMHEVQLHIALVNPYKNNNLFAFLTLQETQNKIVNYDKINSLGIDSVMPVNVNGVYYMNGNISWGFPVRFLKGSFEISSDLSYYKGKQFVNTEGNQIKTVMLGPEIRLDMHPDEKLNVWLSAGLSFNKTKYSLSPTRDSKYFIQNYGFELYWQLPGKFFFESDFNYSVNSQYAEGFNARVPLWNASISRQVLHFNRGEIKLSASDILNQNIGINRTTNQNYIEDSRVKNLRRFFMLSFTYSLSKTGLNKTEGGGIRVIKR